MPYTQPNQATRPLVWKEKRMLRRAPRHPINNDVWETHKDIIVSLYIARNHTVNRIIDILTSENFAPSHRQLSAQLRKWGVRKYVSNQDQHTQPTATPQPPEDTNPRPADQGTSAPSDAPQIVLPQLTDLNGMNTQSEPLEAAVRGTSSVPHDENEQGFGGPELEVPVENTGFDFLLEDLFDFNDFDGFGVVPTMFDNQAVGEADVRHGQYTEEVPDCPPWDNTPER